jgi:hypothetical protein
VRLTHVNDHERTVYGPGRMQRHGADDAAARFPVNGGETGIIGGQLGVFTGLPGPEKESFTGMQPLSAVCVDAATEILSPGAGRTGEAFNSSLDILYTAFS